MNVEEMYQILMRHDVVNELNTNRKLKKTRHLCLMFLTTMPLLRVNGTFLDGKWTFRRKQLEGIADEIGYDFEYTRVALEMLEKLDVAGLVGRICDERVDFHTHWYITEKGVAELEAGISSLIMLLDRMSQVKKEAPKLRGPSDAEKVASIIEEETEKLISQTGS